VWRRIKQVLAALTAKVTAVDRTFAAENLNHAEQDLFFAMNPPDQYHALQVAYTAGRLAAGGGREHVWQGCSGRRPPHRPPVGREH